MPRRQRLNRSGGLILVGRTAFQLPSLLRDLNGVRAVGAEPDERAPNFEGQGGLTAPGRLANLRRPPFRRCRHGTMLR